MLFYFIKNRNYGPDNRILIDNFLEEKNSAIERDDLKEQINKMEIEEENLQKYLMENILSPKIENFKNVFRNKIETKSNKKHKFRKFWAFNN